MQVDQEWQGEHGGQRWMKKQSGNESENRRNMGKMSHADVCVFGWVCVLGGGGREVEIILDSKNENETGEETRNDSPLNGKSSSILLPVCFGVCVFSECVFSTLILK